MPRTDVEVAVVGGGAMGTATAWHLAERGRDVVLLEQFGPDHEHGSSHGNARIFRLAYPDADYLALAREGLALWDRLEADSGRVLRHRVGELDHGDPEVVEEIARQLAAASVPHEVLDPDAAAERWPGLVIDRRAVFHPDGGTTDAAATVAAARDLASAHGARVHHHVTVAGIDPASDQVTLHLASTRGRSGRAQAGAEGLPRGLPERLRARTVVVTAGGWAASLLADTVALPRLVVTREQPIHFTPRRAAPGVGPSAAPWPSFIHYSTDGPPKTSGIDEPVWGYGVPTPDGRLKVGEHHTGEVVAGTATGSVRGTAAGSVRGQARHTAPGPMPPPVADEPVVDPERLARVVAYVRRWVPGVDPASAVPEHCLYTTTASTDFVIDRVGPVVVGAGFSGHGFKFVPRIGQLLADLVEGATAPPRFRLDAHVR